MDRMPGACCISGRMFVCMDGCLYMKIVIASCTIHRYMNIFMYACISLLIFITNTVDM